MIFVEGAIKSHPAQPPCNLQLDLVAHSFKGDVGRWIEIDEERFLEKYGEKLRRHMEDYMIGNTSRGSCPVKKKVQLCGDCDPLVTCARGGTNTCP